MDSKYMRYGISIAKRNLHSLVLDVALLIAEPENENVHSVVGCFRLDRVDMQNSPEFPVTTSPEDDLQQAQRASQMIERAS